MEGNNLDNKSHIYFRQNLFWIGSYRNLWISRNLTYKCFDMHKLYPRASCNIPPTLLVNACLILTTTLSLPMSFSPFLSCLKNMKGTCCRCCLTSATRLSHSSLNVFLQDHKSPLSSLVWICVCLCVCVFKSMCIHGCTCVRSHACMSQ